MKLKDFLNEMTKEYYTVYNKEGKVVSALFPSKREAKSWLYDRANIPKNELKDYEIKPAKKKNSIKEASKNKCNCKEFTALGDKVFSRCPVHGKKR